MSRSHRPRPRPNRRNALVDFLEQRVLLSGYAALSGLDHTVATAPIFVIGKNKVPPLKANTSPAALAVTPDATLAAPFTPSDLQTAYGVTSISFNGTPGNGAGQTIAIVDAYNDPDIIGDANSFSSEFGLPQFNQPGDPTLQVLNENGGTSLANVPNASAGTWDVEESLDVEWAHSIAPKANIELYEANSNNFSDLLSAVQTAATGTGVSVISMSWGGGEFAGENSYDSYFTTPANHQGVTFLASTGDGAAPAGYPAYSPNVVAVGGTSLTLNSDGSYNSESGWSDGGGGVSTQESIPSYQVGKINGLSTTNRAAPDVSMDADPNTGVYVLDSYYDSGYYLQVGGTSLSSPMWAGLIAIADQGRVLNGLTTLDGRSQTLPALYSLPSGDFHDVTSGNNGFAAGPGYDLVTGLGSPIASLVVPGLTGYGAAASSAPTIATNPVSQALITGTSATFTAAATGSPTPTVQWIESINSGSSWSTLAGATSSTYIIPTVLPQDIGDEFEAVFSNSAGTATTTPATLNVYYVATITTNPQSQTVASGTDVSFTTAAFANPTPAVQWDLNTNGVNANWTPISGATLTTLNIGAVTSSESGYQYEAVFTNSAGSTTSTAATLTVNPAAAAPTITTNPQSQSVTAGTAVSFNAAATGNPTPTVQWELSTNGGGIFATIAGATSTTLNLGTVTASETGYEYEAIFTNTAGTIATTIATLTVTPASTGSLAGTEATAAASYNLTTLGTSDWAHWGTGGNASSFVHDASGGSQISNVTKVGSGGYGGWTYSSRDVIWSNGTPTATDSGDDGYIWANNTLGAGYSFTVPASTTSRTVYIYLGGAGAGGTLTATLSDGSATPYSVSMSGSSNFQDIVAITYNAASAGKTLTLTYTKTTTIGSASGSVDLIAAWLAGAPASVGPTITTNPQSQSVTSGTSVSFTAAASGNPTPTVQWQVSTNGGGSYSTISGATSTTLGIGAATIGETGYEYEAVFTNSGGTTTTAPATLTVTHATAPTIATNPQSQSVAVGTAVTFTAAATGNPTPTVQWDLSTNGGTSFAPISGTTSTTLSIGTATIGETGYEYEAVFTNSVGTTTSTAATLTVTQPAGGSLTGTAATAAASYNLTTLGTTDWAHWGRAGNAANFDHDKSGGSQISNVAKVGSGNYGAYTYSSRDVIWTNGTPTSSDSGDGGYLYANDALGAGYSFTVPASTTTHVLYIYLGGASSGGTLTAHLGDNSAANYSVTVSGSSNYQDVVAITYHAGSSTTLTLTYTKTQTIGAASGSVDLIAAWLQ